MKKVLVLGVGAQGSAAARKLDTEPNVSEIICADFDMDAVEHVLKSVKKGRGAHVDAHKIDSIIAAAEGVEQANGVAQIHDPQIYFRLSHNLRRSFQQQQQRFCQRPDRCRSGCERIRLCSWHP